MKKSLFGGAACALLIAACSSSSSTGTTSQGTDGVTKCSDGTTSCDTHCGGKVQPVDPAVCHEEPIDDDDAGMDGMDMDGGDDDTGSDFGATMYGSEGDDDDCKYHVKWSANGVAENSNVTFHVSAVIKSTSAPLTGASPYIEAFLNSTTPAPNAPTQTKDNGDGSYDIGPVQFDKAGQWTVRFHFYGDCTDGNEESQHGHAAFYVTVP
ncbi:MAG TPA: hypothetical protein VF407_06970 [Polyangiaceae bacterium]